ncbi:Transposon Tf2-11 polyprotein [Thelohanellus kitauei]|uniref:RNA-directed DNA polymerase n=1 Tax=Thelohanellus kitauei TaxID=669202 RepID=A0A0C2MYS9_THEKT|nr:Transposon Tf2-11 polyprotein [Thelohanellus kitauei]
MKIEVTINGRPFKMLFDSRASISCMGIENWKTLGKPALQKCTNLYGYMKSIIPTLGKTTVPVEYFGKRKCLTLYVTSGNDIPLAGRDWIEALGIQISTFTDNYSTKILTPYRSLFLQDNKGISGFKATICLSENAKPVVFKPRIVPFAIKNKVEAELMRLVKADVIEEVDPSVNPIIWASSTVNIVKPDGSIRICGDFKATINKYMGEVHYPLTRFEELLENIKGGKYYSTIDLKDAYLQLPLDDNYKNITIIATHRIMDGLIRNIHGVGCFLDDLIISGKDIKENIERVDMVLQRLVEKNIKIKKEKCKFAQLSVKYMAHILDESDIHPSGENIQAIKSQPSPKRAKDLKSLLGAVGFYSRFIPKLHGLCAPLYDLTRQGVNWRWSVNEENILKQIKQCLTHSSTLAHFNEDLPTILATDASGRGLRAVLSQKEQNGIERPVCFASRTLSKSEKNYSVSDKEGLTIIWGINKFNQFLFGRKFTILTDHRPLQRIFRSHDGVPQNISSRLIRWSLRLSAYNYEIKYRDAKNNELADTLSRLPLQSTEDERSPLITLQRETLNDTELSAVMKYFRVGWPEENNVPRDLIYYYEKRDSLSTEESLMTWNDRIIIPKRTRNSILKLLHEGHPGISGMKSIVRSYVRWPKIDEDIETYVITCQLNSASYPLERLYVDFSGPLDGIMWIVLIDAYTKWIEVYRRHNINAETLIDILYDFFSRFGVPKSIVSDNGKQFYSDNYIEFCRKYAKLESRIPANRQLAQALYFYRNTQTSSTLRCPSELMLGRKHRGYVDNNQPDVVSNSNNGIWKQKKQFAKFKTYIEIGENQQVWVKNELSTGYRPATIKGRTGDLSYEVMDGDKPIRKHANQ